jgi:N-acetylglucosaminyldiphosphoundecaprenol N-acetyl-beta-D-mannosaminyltransferase
MARDFITLLGINIDVLDLRSLIENIDNLISNKKKGMIMYVNVHTINIACTDQTHRFILNNADFVYCDGEGVRWGARILGKLLPKRMTGADWIWDLCEMCEKKNYSLYLLGGEGGVAEKAAQNLQRTFPNLEIAGTYHGYFQKYGIENDKVIASINKKSPDILLVGFGSPLQEKWVHENFEKLNSHIIWAVGAMMDFVSEKVSRGPRWMLDNGMEWLFRLIIEPGRMWKRYIIGNLVFFAKIIKEKY